MAIVCFVSDHFGGYGDFLFALKLIEALQEKMRAQGYVQEVLLVSQKSGQEKIRRLMGDKDLGIAVLSLEEYEVISSRDGFKLDYFIEGPTFHPYVVKTNSLALAETTPVLLVTEYAYVSKTPEDSYKNGIRNVESVYSGFNLVERQQGVLLTEYLVEVAQQKQRGDFSFREDAWAALEDKLTNQLRPNKLGMAAYHRTTDLTFEYSHNDVVEDSCDHFLNVHLSYIKSSQKNQDVILVGSNTHAKIAAFKKIQSQLYAIYDKIIYIDLDENKQEIIAGAQISHGKIYRLFHVRRLKHSQMLALQALSGDLVGATGDQSFIESAGKLVVYECYPHKVNFSESYFDRIIKNIENPAGKKLIRLLNTARGEKDYRKLVTLFAKKSLVAEVKAVILSVILRCNLIDTVMDKIKQQVTTHADGKEIKAVAAEEDTLLHGLIKAKRLALVNLTNIELKQDLETYRAFYARDNHVEAILGVIKTDTAQLFTKNKAGVTPWQRIEAMNWDIAFFCHLVTLKEVLARMPSEIVAWMIVKAITTNRLSIEVLQAVLVDNNFIHAEFQCLSLLPPQSFIRLINHKAILSQLSAASISAANANGRILLFDAIQYADDALVLKLLEKNPNLNIRNQSGATLLQWAIMHDRQTVIDKFSQEPTLLILKSKVGGSALTTAFNCNHRFALRCICALWPDKKELGEMLIKANRAEFTRMVWETRADVFAAIFSPNSYISSNSHLLGFIIHCWESNINIYNLVEAQRDEIVKRCLGLTWDEATCKKMRTLLVYYPNLIIPFFTKVQHISFSAVIKLVNNVNILSKLPAHSLAKFAVTGDVTQYFQMLAEILIMCDRPVISGLLKLFNLDPNKQLGNMNLITYIFSRNDFSCAQRMVILKNCKFLNPQFDFTRINTAPSFVWSKYPLNFIAELAWLDFAIVLRKNQSAEAIWDVLKKNQQLAKLTERLLANFANLTMAPQADLIELIQAAIHENFADAKDLSAQSVFELFFRYPQLIDQVGKKIDSFVAQCRLFAVINSSMLLRAQAGVLINRLRAILTKLQPDTEAYEILRVSLKSQFQLFNYFALSTLDWQQFSHFKPEAMVYLFAPAFTLDVRYEGQSRELLTHLNRTYASSFNLIHVAVITDDIKFVATNLNQVDDINSLCLALALALKYKCFSVLEKLMQYVENNKQLDLAYIFRTYTFENKSLFDHPNFEKHRNRTHVLIALQKFADYEPAPKHFKLFANPSLAQQKAQKELLVNVGNHVLTHLSDYPLLREVVHYVHASNEADSRLGHSKRLLSITQTELNIFKPGTLEKPHLARMLMQINAAWLKEFLDLQPQAESVAPVAVTAILDLSNENANPLRLTQRAIAKYREKLATVHNSQSLLKLRHDFSLPFSILHFPNSSGFYILMRGEGAILGLGGWGKVKRAYYCNEQNEVEATMLAIKIERATHVNKARKNLSLFAQSQPRPQMPYLYKIGVIDGKQYAVMPYLPGVELKQYLKNPHLTMLERFEIAKAFLKAVAELHSIGVAHLDLKAANVLYDKKTNKIYLVDFGCAEKFKESIKYDRLAWAKFSIEHMPPEYLHDNCLVNPALDMYSCVALLAEIFEVPVLDFIAHKFNKALASVSDVHFQQIMRDLMKEYHSLDKAIFEIPLLKEFSSKEQLSWTVENPNLLQFIRCFCGQREYDFSAVIARLNTFADKESVAAIGEMMQRMAQLDSAKRPSAVEALAVFSEARPLGSLQVSFK